MSEDAQGVLLMKRALARTDAELNGNRARYLERAACLAGRLIDTGRGSAAAPGVYDRERSSPATPVKPEDIQNMSYEEALAALIVNPHTTYYLRQRLREDGQRDPVQALRDAELLVALLQAKQQSAKEAGAGPEPAAPERREDKDDGGGGLRGGGLL